MHLFEDFCKQQPAFSSVSVSIYLSITYLYTPFIMNKLMHNTYPE